jgi:hypothetical protein
MPKITAMEVACYALARIRACDPDPQQIATVALADISVLLTVPAHNAGNDNASAEPDVEAPTGIRVLN